MARIVYEHGDGLYKLDQRVRVATSKIAKLKEPLDKTRKQLEGKWVRVETLEQNDGGKRSLAVAKANVAELETHCRFMEQQLADLEDELLQAQDERKECMAKRELSERHQRREIWKSLNVEFGKKQARA